MHTPNIPNFVQVLLFDTVTCLSWLLVLLWYYWYCHMILILLDITWSVIWVLPGIIRRGTRIHGIRICELTLFHLFHTLVYYLNCSRILVMAYAYSRSVLRWSTTAVTARNSCLLIFGIIKADGPTFFELMVWCLTVNIIYTHRVSIIFINWVLDADYLLFTDISIVYQW